MDFKARAQLTLNVDLFSIINTVSTFDNWFMIIDNSIYHWMDLSLSFINREDNLFAFPKLHSVFSCLVYPKWNVYVRDRDVDIWAIVRNVSGSPRLSAEKGLSSCRKQRKMTSRHRKTGWIICSSHLSPIRVCQRVLYTLCWGCIYFLLV